MTNEHSSLSRTVIIAFGFASIVLALLANPILTPDLSATYHWSGAALTLFGPVFVFVTLLSAALFILLLSARQPGRWRIAVWSGLLLPTPWFLFRIAVLHWGTHLASWIRTPPIASAALIWLLVMLFWRPVHSARSEWIIKIAGSVLVYLGLSGSFLLCALLYSWWEARLINDPLPLRQKGTATVSGVRRPRVIWIILDELSYDQVFEHRFSGLLLPAFDSLAAESTVFTHVVPVGLQTDEVVPALFIGRPVSKIASSSAGGLLLPDVITGKWQRFPEHDTVFQDALNLGYSTGIVGWYNPYCRIMPEVLCSCSWSDSVSLVDGVAPDRGLSNNLLGPFDTLLGDATLSKLFGSTFSYQDRKRSGQIADYWKLVKDGDSLLADSSADFVLLHMPFPHPPGIFNRTTGEFSGRQQSYLDNLSLADRYIAHVRTFLSARGEWDSSTVLVMGDHSWRTALIWKHAGNWTREEEQASDGGRFDDRPAYLLKLSGQQSGQRIESPFPALKTRHLLDGILAGRIATTRDLEAWLRPTQ